MIMQMCITTIDDCGFTAIAPIRNVSTDLGAASGLFDR